MMERYVPYTPPHRVELLRKMIGQTITGLTAVFPWTDGASGGARTPRSFGRTNAMLTITLANGLIVDVTPLGALRSMLVRSGSVHGIKWGEFGLLVNGTSANLLDDPDGERWLDEAVARPIVEVRMLRTTAPTHSFGLRGSALGLELAFADGGSLVIGQRLTTVPHHLTVMPKDRIDPGVAHLLEAIDVSALPRPAPLPLPVTDPFNERRQADLREHRASLSSEMVDYDIFRNRVIRLGTCRHFNQASRDDLLAIREYLTRNARSVTDIQLYVDAGGRVSVAEPIDILDDVAPDVDAMIIDALIAGIAA